MQEVDVQRVALDPLAAVEEVAQRPQLPVDGDADGVLDGRTRTHLVGHRADAADAGGDVGWLGEPPVAQEPLEEPGRLVDVELHVDQLAVAHLDPHGPFTLDPGQGVGAEGPTAGGSMGHVVRLLGGSTGTLRNGSDQALKVWNRRPMASSSTSMAREGTDQRLGVGGLHRPEAAVAAAVERGAQRAAAGLGDRAEARGAVGHHHADVALLLALDADAVVGHDRLAPDEEGADHLEQLAAVDRAAAQLEVDLDVVGDGRRGVEGGEERRRGVDDAQELFDVAEVAQRLDAAGGGAGADGDQEAGLAPHLLDALDVLGGGDRALDQGHVVGAGHRGAGRLEEVGDLQLLGHGEQLVLAVQQRELAAVAAGELPHGERRLGGAHRCLTRISGSTVGHGSTGPSLQTNAGPSWQCPQWPMAQCMLRSRDTKIWSRGTPRAAAAWAVNRIMTSGPHTYAVVCSGSTGAGSISLVTTPTLPRQLGGAVSTVTSTSMSSGCARTRAGRGRAGRRVRGHRPAARRGRSPRGWP